MGAPCRSIRPAVEEVHELQGVGGGADFGLDLGLGEPCQGQAEPDVLRHRQVGLEHVVLEHHGDATARRLLPGWIIRPASTSTVTQPVQRDWRRWAT
jgi:hypothetical protein